MINAVTISGWFFDVGELRELLDEIPSDLDRNLIKVGPIQPGSAGFQLDVIIRPTSIDAIDCGNHVPEPNDEGRYIVPRDIIVNTHVCSAD
jgi:hypothetical protein